MGGSLPRRAAFVRGLPPRGADFGGIQLGCRRVARGPKTRLRRGQHENHECAGRESVSGPRIPQRLGAVAPLMLRRELLATLSACAVGRARGTANLESFFESR